MLFLHSMRSTKYGCSSWPSGVLELWSPVVSQAAASCTQIENPPFVHSLWDVSCCMCPRSLATFDQDDGAGADQRRSPHQPEVSRLPLTHVFCVTSVQRHLSSSAVYVFTLLPFQSEALLPTLRHSSLHMKLLDNFSVLKYGSVLFVPAFCALSAVHPSCQMLSSFFLNRIRMLSFVRWQSNSQHCKNLRTDVAVLLANKSAVVSGKS